MLYAANIFKILHTIDYRDRKSGMKLVLWFVGIVALLALILGLTLSHTSDLGTSTGIANTSYTVVLDGASVRVALARTSAEQERGLGGRDSLAPDEGMLFIFSKDGQYAFWMKDMLFSIDIIWLASDSRVVYIVPNLSPGTYPAEFRPPEAARFVLEVPAGWAAEYQVHIGDTAQLP